MTMDADKRALSSTTGSFLAVSVVHGTTALAYLAVVVLLGRELPRADYGRVSLVYYLSLLLPLLTSLGLPLSLLRKLAARPLDEWAWKRFFWRALGLSGALATAAGGAVGLVYGLHVDELATVAVVSNIGVLVVLVASVYKAQGRVIAAVAIERGGFLWVLGLVCWWWPSDPGRAVQALAVGHGIQGIVALSLLATLPSGRARAPDGLYRDGLSLQLMDATMLLLSGLDRLLIPRLLSHAHLGAYMAVFNIMRGYTILCLAALSVLVPRLSRDPGVSPRRFWPRMLLLGLGVSAAYAALGGPILHILYGGAYDQERYLLLPLLLAQLFALLFAVPKATLDARGSRAIIVRAALANLVILVLCLVFVAVLTTHLGLRGTAYGMVITWISIFGVAQVFASAVSRPPASA